jgi:hypothetical protein
MNEKRVMEERELLELLQDYPVPEAEAGFYDRAVVRAVHNGSRRQRNRWILAGFGSAIAAGLAIWVIPARRYRAGRLSGTARNNLGDEPAGRQEPAAADAHCTDAGRR